MFIRKWNLRRKRAHCAQVSTGRCYERARRSQRTDISHAGVLTVSMNRIKNQESRIKSRGVFSRASCLVSRASRAQRGFTLVEMIVAIALFSVVMIVCVGALLALVNANRKAQALQSVMNNLNIALDGMVRSVRMGNSY